jgi:hypothetical protein
LERRALLGKFGKIQLPPAEQGSALRFWLGFEVFISLKIFDRNLNVRFYKCMVATGLQESPMHDLMHSQLFNHSYV